MGVAKRIRDCGAYGVNGVEKRTGHKVREVAERLAEDDVAVLRDTLLELLLEIAAAVLVLAKRRDLALHVLQAHASKAVNCKVFSTSIRSSEHTERTLAIDVTALVLRPVQTVHLAVCAAVGAPVHVEAILCTVMVIQRRGASRPDSRTTTGGLKPVRVETPALDGSRKPVDAITAILLPRPLSISV